MRIVGGKYRHRIISWPDDQVNTRPTKDRIREAIPEIVDGPFYKGVDSLGDSSVNLLFVATVK